MHSQGSEQHVQKKKPRRRGYAPPAGWGPYHQWSTAEIPRVLELVQLVLETADLRPRTGKRGAPRFPFLDLLKCLLVKVYFRLSYRRAVGLLVLLQQPLRLARVPHFNTLVKWMNDRYVSVVLERVVGFVAMMKEVDDKALGIDATGFLRARGSPWSFVREKKRRFLRRGYRKAHLACALPSRTILAMDVTPGRVHDRMRFEPLLKRAAERDRFDRVLADRAYLSIASCEAAREVGATPVIPPKKNSKLRANPKNAFEKMVNFAWHFHNRFWAMYDWRRGVESIISEIKRIFGDRLACRRITAQRNELLLVGALYNLRVVSRAWIRVE